MSSLNELLAMRRRRSFVGRVAETELFRAALGASEAPFAVLYIHGPGGLGKTTLLDVLATIAEEAGAHVIRLDGRTLVPSPASMLATLRASVDVPDGEAPVTSFERLVVLIDSYERLAPVDDWLRTCFLTRLPATSLTVIEHLASLQAATPANPRCETVVACEASSVCSISL